MNRTLVKSLLIRAEPDLPAGLPGRAAGGPALDLSGPVLKAAAVAGLASVLSMINRLLDETPVRSLTDPTTAPSAQPIRSLAATA
jgi:hypothetical protein